MTTGSICRGLPDVTALSGDISVLAGEVPTKTTTGLANGYTDWEGATQDAAGNVTHGSATVDGGTSLSTPLWVGMWTRMQAASTDAHGLGFAPAALYAIGLDAVKDPTAFFDISVGQNGQNQAVPRTPTVDPTGWDYVSGLGAPDVGVLMQDLAGTTANLKPVLPGDTAYTVTESAAPPSSCPPNGSIPDPAADTAATTTDTQPDAFDLTHVGYVLGADGQTISISDTVTDLADSTDPALLFENQFTFENVDYYANFERDQPGATETLTLNTLNGTTFEFEQKLVMSGGFDDATNTVTGSFTIAAFNAAVHPAVNMARGDRFLALSTQTSGETDPFAADTASTSCPYVIGGVAADPTVPEAPSLPLLLGAVLPAGALVLWRRRRAARA